MAIVVRPWRILLEIWTCLESILCHASGIKILGLASNGLAKARKLALASWKANLVQKLEHRFWKFVDKWLASTNSAAANLFSVKSQYMAILNLTQYHDKKGSWRTRPMFLRGSATFIIANIPPSRTLTVGTHRNILTLIMKFSEPVNSTKERWSHLIDREGYVI